VDHGSAVSIAGVPDPDIRGSLEELMPVLGLKQAKVRHTAVSACLLQHSYAMKAPGAHVMALSP
jgi:hypothetical protein